MSNRTRSHLRTNVVGYVALFLVLTMGTAYATHPGGDNTIDSGDVIDEQLRGRDIAADEVRSSDVRNDTLAGGGLRAPDLAADSVIASEIASEAVSSDEVHDQSLTEGDLAPDSVSASEIEANSVGTSEAVNLTGDDVVDASLTGADVAGNSLTGADIDESSLDGLDAADGFDDFLDPGTTTFTDSGAAASLTLSAPTAVLVMATTHFASDGSPSASGTCRLELNGAANSGDHPIGELDADDDTSPTVHQGGMNLVDVQFVTAGFHTWNIACNETDNDIEFRNLRLAVLELSIDS